MIQETTQKNPEWILSLQGGKRHECRQAELERDGNELTGSEC